ncbi:hypothetical protein SMD11_6874 [Streptomyces albireticuli]|uniref:Ricin B lectin domain-containing protein n=1 Tax=Streptomyces albireticuli TaxID=1940 RepID=A0A1Z2LDQ9_9ACTN|nr:hypothetical protein SMD11_6874 [Streptomyces albireticuli]
MIKHRLAIAATAAAFALTPAVPAAAQNHHPSVASASANSVHYLQNYLSGRCVDVNGYSADNYAVVLNWDCNGGTNQRWEFRPTGDGTHFYLVVAHSGKCLTVNAADGGTGQRVVQFQCVGADTQMWRPVYQGNDTYQLIEKRSGKCFSLDTRGGLGNGAGYLSWPCEGGPNQLWKLLNV